MFSELLGLNYKGVQRLESRYKMIVEPFLDEISGKSVLDLACHDGRWSLLFAVSGARRVVGVEGRPDVLEKFKDFPGAEHTDKIELRCNDIFAELESEVANGADYDVVAILGVFYHIVDHFKLLNLVRSLNPKLIIIDSQFAHDATLKQTSRPIIVLSMETTQHDLCPIPGPDGREAVAIGIPSFSAMELMARSIDHSIEWVDPNILPTDQRAGVDKYFKTAVRAKYVENPISFKRATCALRPK